MALEVVSIGAAEGSDLTVPDLVLMPDEAPDSDRRLMPPDLVGFAMEVVDPGDSTTDTVAKVDRYASWDIPIYLLVDPRNGTLICRSRPRDGVYLSVQRYEYGDVVELSAPLKDVTLETSDLRRYSESMLNEE